LYVEKVPHSATFRVGKPTWAGVYVSRVRSPPRSCFPGPPARKSAVRERNGPFAPASRPKSEGGLTGTWKGEKNKLTRAILVNLSWRGADVGPGRSAATDATRPPTTLLLPRAAILLQRKSTSRTLEGVNLSIGKNPNSNTYGWTQHALSFGLSVKLSDRSPPGRSTLRGATVGTT